MLIKTLTLAACAYLLYRGVRSTLKLDQRGQKPEEPLEKPQAPIQIDPETGKPKK